MKASKFIYYLALLIGFQTTAFFLFFLVPEGISGLIDGSYNVVVILAMMLYSITGFIVAIKNPRKGGLLMISGGIIMAIYLLFLGGLGEYKMSIIFGMPFCIPGLLFYFGPAKSLLQKA